jgi:hypothetical protein
MSHGKIPRKTEVARVCNRSVFAWRQLLRPQKSQPRNGAGEIFMTAAAEIARKTVSAANRLKRETGNPRKYARK